MTSSLARRRREVGVDIEEARARDMPLAVQLAPA
jgi:hypothetical protein